MNVSENGVYLQLLPCKIIKNRGHDCNRRYAPFSEKKHWVQIGGILPYQTHILKKMMISNPHSQNDDDIKPPYQTHILKMMMVSNLHIKAMFSNWRYTSVSNPHSRC